MSLAAMIMVVVLATATAVAAAATAAAAVQVMVDRLGDNTSSSNTGCNVPDANI